MLVAALTWLRRPCKGFRQVSTEALTHLCYHANLHALTRPNRHSGSACNVRRHGDLDLRRQERRRRRQREGETDEVMIVAHDALVTLHTHGMTWGAQRTWNSSAGKTSGHANNKRQFEGCALTAPYATPVAEFVSVRMALGSSNTRSHHEGQRLLPKAGRTAGSPIRRMGSFSDPSPTSCRRCSGHWRCRFFAISTFTSRTA